MKILITGANGLLGGELFRLAQQESHVVLATDKETVDIANEKIVQKAIRESHPTIILNCAVIGPTESEKDPKLAKQVNVVGAMNLFKHANGARFIQFSSPAVFDGNPPLQSPKLGPNYDYGYTEKDEVNAVSVYGKTKIELEQQLVSTNALVIRTSWLYSETRLAESIPTSAINDIGRPTLCADVWKTINILLKENLTGAYHVCGPEILSRLDQATILHGKNVNPTELPKTIIRPLSIAKIQPILAKHGVSLTTWKEEVTHYNHKTQCSG